VELAQHGNFVLDSFFSDPLLSSQQGPKQDNQSKMSGKNWVLSCYFLNQNLPFCHIPGSQQAFSATRVVNSDVFGPLGSASGSASHKYGSGSFHQAKIVRKTLISTVL
jgi:hypothetical protein